MSNLAVAADGEALAAVAEKAVRDKGLLQRRTGREPQLRLCAERVTSMSGVVHS